MLTESTTGKIDSAIAGAKLMTEYLNGLKNSGSMHAPKDFFKEETAMEDLMSLMNLSIAIVPASTAAMHAGNIVPVTIEPITGMVP